MIKNTYVDTSPNIAYPTIICGDVADGGAGDGGGGGGSVEGQVHSPILVILGASQKQPWQFCDSR